MAVTTSMYNSALAALLAAFNWTSATIYVALFSASTFGATNAAYTTEGTEVVNANGYTTGGQAVGTRTADGTTTVAAKISAATVWTATGAGFTAHAAKLYISAGIPLCHIDFGADVTASGGGTWTLTWAAGGVFSIG